MPKKPSSKSDSDSLETDKPAAQKPVIFTYTDYRDYFRAMVAYLRAAKKPHSNRYFARIAGFGSPSYLSMVMLGQRHMTLPSILKFAKAFQLNKKETAYFTALISYDNAKSEEEKEHHLKELLAMRPQGQYEGIDQDRIAYLTRPLFVVIRELTALKEFQEDPEWIAKALRLTVKPGEIQEALKVLERLKLVKRDGRGRLHHSGTSVTTPDDLPLLDLMNYQRQMLSLSKDAIMTAPAEGRDALAKTIPIPKDLLAKVQEVLNQAFADVTEIVNHGGKDFHEVYQINLQFFPLSMVNSMRKTTK